MQTSFRWRGVAVVAVAMTVFFGGVACTDDSEDKPEPSPSAAPTEVTPTTSIVKVTGKLDKKRRAPLRKDVSATVDRWLEKKQPSEPKWLAKKMTLDILAAGGLAKGVTARVKYVYSTGDTEERRAVTGQVNLVPVNHRWKVFAFDVKRGQR